MKRQEEREQLKAEIKEVFSFMSELSPEQQDVFLDHTVLEFVAADTVLAEKIGNCPGLALILSGELRVSRISGDGREVTLYRIGKGRTCPLSAICILGGNIGYAAKVIASVDTKLLWLSKDYVNRSMFLCEPFWRFLFNCMTNRLLEAMDIVDDIAFVPIRKRLAQLLLTSSNRGKQAVYATHEALAKEIGTAREVISRELKNLERSDAVILSRGKINVKDPAQLEIIANSRY
ncbi:MAG: Crp/Fnr family transcriptional regulator [Peptococcaceae bacterium]|jgi:CRP/FNR family transcriptional regulator|nr:Crp/Fnr family transcriptional regulator [Peptococcaceae bacterium]